ncbi:uncharacterized protein PG986_013273 [Apiospora aurea]|uniref:Ras modification protein ERF4 n=1 Tax=Apiospora aurea TaxID=335848 RepID=A0ABR1PV40_9PEZI
MGSDRDQPLASSRLGAAAEQSAGGRPREQKEGRGNSCHGAINTKSASSRWRRHQDLPTYTRRVRKSRAERTRQFDTLGDAYFTYPRLAGWLPCSATATYEARQSAIIIRTVGREHDSGRVTQVYQANHPQTSIEGNDGPSYDWEENLKETHTADANGSSWSHFQSTKTEAAEAVVLAGSWTATRSISRPLTAGSTATPSQSTIQPGLPGRRRAICSQILSYHSQACNLIATPTPTPTPTTPVARRHNNNTPWVFIPAPCPDSNRRSPNGHLCGLPNNSSNPVAQDLSTPSPFHQLRKPNSHLRHAGQQRRRRVRVIYRLAARPAAAASFSKRLHTSTFLQRQASLYSADPSTQPGHQQQRFVGRPAAARLWNPTNSTPRPPPRQQSPRRRRASTPPPPNVPLDHPVINESADPRDPIGTGAGDYPLLTLPQQRQNKHPAVARASLRIEGRASGDHRISLPRSLRHSYDGKPGLQSPPAQEAEAGPSKQRPRTDRHRTRTGFASPRRSNDNVSLPDGLGSPISSTDSSIMGDPDQPDMGEEWGPQHPCFPHLNPHVPIGSPEYAATRVIRIRRDWLLEGDLAPTFSNLYPEILDPAGITEQEFRRVIEKLNNELVPIFNPYYWRNIVDGVMGLVTGWIWDDLGFTYTKSRLKTLELWIEKWNNEMEKAVGIEDPAMAPKIVPLRRTGYMNLDIQIPDPEIAPAVTASQPNSRSGLPAEPEPAVTAGHVGDAQP